jgi:hypothetical protein
MIRSKPAQKARPFGFAVVITLFSLVASARNTYSPARLVDWYDRVNVFGDLLMQVAYSASAEFKVSRAIYYQSQGRLVGGKTNLRHKEAPKAQEKCISHLVHFVPFCD